jgi:hypothetical protein
MSVRAFDGLQVWKPARQQTWKSAALGGRPVEIGGSARMRSGLAGGKNILASRFEMAKIPAAAH